MTALCTLETTIAMDSVAMPMAANGALEAIWPLAFVQILEASFLVGETLDKLAETQGFFLRHNWHHLYEAILYYDVSNISDIFPYLVLCLLKPAYCGREQQSVR